MGSVVGAGLVRETGPGYVFLFARNVINLTIWYHAPFRNSTVREGA